MVVIMKKIFQLFIFLVLISLFLIGCKKENQINENSISIVATNFPAYDFARSVVTKVDENYLAPTNNFTNVDIKLLIKPGMETHSFDPTPKDIIDIQNADIFIYMGGHSESWVEKILETSNKLPKKIIKLKDVVEITHNHEQHETEHNHNEHEEDEHFWTDSKNAIKMISTILENIIEVDNEKTNGKYIEEYQSNANSYINQINKLSSEIKNTVDNSKNKFLIFGDRFPFTYFADEYGLDYVAAFDGCSSAVEAKTSKLAELIDIAKEKNAKAIFKIEMSNGKIAQTIADATDAKILELHSCQNVTKDDFNKGVTYAFTMNSNLNTLREGL